MAGIPERIIDEIRFRNDIVDVVGSYITLKRAGANSFKACCPFHKEKTPSFHVNPQRQIFKCFGCGAGGNVFKFLQLYEGMDFLTAVKALAKRANIPLEFEKGDSAARGQRQALYKIHSELAQFYRRCLLHETTGATARAYLEERKLEGEIAEEFLIGYAPDRWDSVLRWADKYGYRPQQLLQAGLLSESTRGGAGNKQYDRFRDRIMFPIFDGQGRVVGFSGRLLQKDVKAAKYVNSPETPIFHKGRVLYALDKARRHIVSATPREAIVSEGQIDVIRCHQAGFKSAIACQGTAFTAEHAGVLKRYADGVLIVFDSDDAGRDAAIKAAVTFMDAGLVARIATLPAGEDPDSFLLSKGAEAFQGLLDEATSAIRFQMRTHAAREKDPGSVGAVDRIAKAVLETIAHSPNAVQQARMLQEAAEELNIPSEALRQDLEHVIARQRKQAQRNRQRPLSPPSPRPAPPARGPSPVPRPPPPPNLGYIEEDEDYGPEDFGVPPSAVPTPETRKAHLEEKTLCEHLVQAYGDGELIRLVTEYLPLELVGDETCRALVRICLEAPTRGEPLESALAKAAQDEMLTRLATACRQAPRRILGREFSHMSAVEDLVLALWQHRLRTERDLLLQRANALTDEERAAQGAQRQQLTYDISHLKRWDTGRVIIEIHREETIHHEGQA